MSSDSSGIICNLKNVRSLNAESQNLQIKNSKKFISRFLNRRKKLKFDFNHKLLIKSLFSNLENKNTNFFLKQDNIKKGVLYNVIPIKKNKVDNNRYNYNKFPKLRKSRSHFDINEEKNFLNENDIKSNETFKDLCFDDLLKKEEMNFSSQKDFVKENQNKEGILNSFKKINHINKNLSLLINKKSQANVKLSRKSNFNNHSVINRNKKLNRSTQSSNDIGSRKLINNSYFIHNKSLQPNLSASNIFFKKKEYLKFLEKKSLDLRANIIVNNIQQNRGGKQEIRQMYDPLDK